MIKYNKMKYSFPLLLLLLLFGACNKDVLDTEPYDKISEDVVWQNKANAETFIFSTYDLMYDLAGGPSSDAYTTNLLGFDDIYNGAAGVFNGRVDVFNDYGFNNWSEVRRCNLIIKKVSESEGIAESDKKELIAEAKFLRAMSYFDVARKIGRIVWIDEVLTPDDNLDLSSTASPAESYDYILKDLEDAIQDLPETKVSGRANKYVAAAMYTEVGLQALAYQNYPASPSIDPGNPILTKIIEYGNLVVDAGGYAMEADYGSMFNDVNPYSSEIIFGIYRKSVNTYLNSTPMQLMAPNLSNNFINQYGGSPLLTSSSQVFEAWLQHSPTQNFVDDYLVVDKNDPSKAVAWDETSQYKDAVQEGVQISETDIPKADGETTIKSGKIKAGSQESIWTLTNTNRDARWQSSIVSDSTQYYGELITTNILGNAPRWMKINGNAYYLSLSNLYWRKGMYTNVSPTLLVGTPTDYHWVITRLGRVNLNLAEAYLLKNDVQNAVSKINTTRETHGALPPTTASSADEVWNDYKRERRVDLVLENDYYWSLLRWGRYGGAANHGLGSNSQIPELVDQPYVMDVSNDRDAFSIVKGQFYGANDLREFNVRRYLFPIAKSYLDRNSNFGPQNPGW